MNYFVDVAIPYRIAKRLVDMAIDGHRGVVEVDGTEYQITDPTYNDDTVSIDFYPYDEEKDNTAVCFGHWLEMLCVIHNKSRYAIAKESVDEEGNAMVKENNLSMMIRNNAPLEKLNLTTFWGICTALGIDPGDTFEHYRSK